MITRHIREHDGDSYLTYEPEADDFECECGRIVSKNKSCLCEVCQRQFCSACGCGDYKKIGWFVCLDCQEHPERILDAVLSTL